MYLPLGSPTLLRLLQLPLSFLNPNPSPSSFVALDEPSGLHHLNVGSTSPYHDAPSIPGVSADLPDDCTVDQVILLHRHGSRGPLGEERYILKLVDTLDKARDAIQAVNLPPYLEFLKKGYAYHLLPKELTAVGRKELFEHGVEFALRYPTFSTDEVVSTTVPRVIDSAHFFSQGFFGRGAENVTFLTTDDCEDEISWLAPDDLCPKLSAVEACQAVGKWTERYIPPIVSRLDELVPGVGFSFEDVRGALYACPYDLAARDASPWCNVFTSREIEGLEYESDLLLDGYSGHASRGDPGPLLGAFYIKKLIERLTNSTKDARHLYLDFAHDVNILFTLSTMGLNKDAVPLSPDQDRPPADRKFKSSHQTPFAANMVWERFTCQRTFRGPQVRLVLNGATFPLSICAQSDEDMKYGTCSLDAFVRANAYSIDAEYKSDVWNATCGVPV